jgi:hypothetical protein
MEDLICCIITKNFPKLVEPIKIPTQDIQRIIHMVIYTSKVLQFTDCDLFTIIKPLLSHTTLLEDADILLNLLKPHKKTYTLLHTHTRYHLTKARLDKYNSYLTNTNTDIIKSFLEPHFLQILRMKNKDPKWQEINTEEILTRFEQLFQYYTLDLFKHIGVETITIKDFLESSYESRATYYISCINSLSTFISIVEMNTIMCAKLKYCLNGICETTPPPPQPTKQSSAKPTPVGVAP